MSILSEIRDTIEEMAHQNGEARSAFHVGTVRKVADDGETCEVDVMGDTWTGVRLTAVASGGCDVKVFPAVGSHVLVADLSNGSMSDLAVLMLSKFEKVEMGEAKHTSVNGDVLRKELEKLTKRVDIIYQAIQTAKPTPQDGGAALQAAMVATLATATDKESFSQIEDKNIMH